MPPQHCFILPDEWGRHHLGEPRCAADTTPRRERRVAHRAWLAEAREYRGATQVELGNAVGASQRVIAYYGE
jgi:hypothetical protein